MDESIAREYLELNGFVTMPLRKGRAQSKRSQGEEGLDLYIRNTRFTETDRPPSFLLFSSELKRLRSAVVCVRGWHCEKAALAAMKSGADMLRYVESNVLKKVDKWFEFEQWRELGESSFPKRVLVAPAFPTQEAYRARIETALREKGVDGVLSFKSMLLDIIDRVDTRHVYPKSDLLQLVRTLKTFDLIKDSQMNFL
ncbi:MAG TPA: hypothetical protein DIV79_00040 [Opitutae bacterium]|nr:hypothetical protein [Opitutaceae bacterium]HCR28389.1 hypothetical protein [Opitutae bacterium]